MKGCSRWLVRPANTPEEVRIKTLMFPFVLFLFVCTVIIIVSVMRGANQMVSLIGLCTSSFAMLLFMGGALSNLISACYLLDAWLVLCTVGTCFLDLANATRSSPIRSWPIVVLVLDVALVFKRDHMPYFIIAVVLLYQAALHAESVQRFGLFEAGYWGSKGIEISSCNCASPPCADAPSGAAITMANVCTVFLGDFYFTNGFASGMMLQVRRVEASV
eukprot:Hpha_TRINITY_DN15908_c11_g4::TRINITY_DN15908_c11_g4_i2::g.71517::m.71517